MLYPYLGFWIYREDWPWGTSNEIISEQQQKCTMWIDVACSLITKQQQNCIFIIIKYVGSKTPIYFGVVNIVLVGRVSIFYLLI